MKILVCSDSFKGCMTSSVANARMAAGILRASPDTQLQTFAVSDGGEGMTEAFAAACRGQIKTIRAKDLYGAEIFVRWGYDPHSKIACIEAASTLGVTLYPYGRRRPLLASSEGLGLLLKEIMKKDVRRIVIGLGGTGTNDGGMGFLAAFGAVFYDVSRRPLQCCAQNLSKIAFIDKRGFHFDGRVELIVACDVQNPLLGASGATWIFGKQKGLHGTQMEDVERGMRHLAAKIDQTFHVDMSSAPGSGAAGGLGGMLQAVFGARQVSGLQLLAKMGGLQEKIAWADAVFTGEGQTDAQSACGKVVSQVAGLARESGTPVICLSGALGVGYEKLYEQGVCAMFSTADRAMSFSQALHHGPAKLEQAAFNLMKLMDAVRKER